MRSDRISRLLRVQLNPSFSGELFSKNLGLWTRIRKQADVAGRVIDGSPQPAPGPSLQGLLDVLIHERAASVRLATEADRVAAQTPLHRLAVYVEAVAADDAEGERLLDDTMARQWGLALWRQGQVWQAMEQQDGQLAYTLRDETVEALLAPLQSRQVIALVPQQVTSVSLQTPGETSYQLKRIGSEEWVVDIDGRTLPADSRQVFRYLSNLA